MGTWGTGVFENDAALDFSSALGEIGSVSEIADFLSYFLSGSGEYIEIEDGQEAIVAADFVARLISGKAHNEPSPGDAEGWVSSNADGATADVVKDATLALERCMVDKSELLELWHESPMFAEWIGVLEDIRMRLT